MPESALRAAPRYHEFLDFFAESGIEMINVTAEILAMATAIRAHQGLKMIDAIQVATPVR